MPGPGIAAIITAASRNSERFALPIANAIAAGRTPPPVRARSSSAKPGTAPVHQPRPALRGDGGRCTGAVPGFADEDRARAGGGVLPVAIALAMDSACLLYTSPSP